MDRILSKLTQWKWFVAGDYWKQEVSSHRHRATGCNPGTQDSIGHNENWWMNYDDGMLPNLNCHDTLVYPSFRDRYCLSVDWGPWDDPIWRIRAAKESLPKLEKLIRHLLAKCLVPSHWIWSSLVQPRKAGICWSNHINYVLSCWHFTIFYIIIMYIYILHIVHQIPLEFSHISFLHRSAGTTMPPCCWPTASSGTMELVVLLESMMDERSGVVNLPDFLSLGCVVFVKTCHGIEIWWNRFFFWGYFN